MASKFGFAKRAGRTPALRAMASLSVSLAAALALVTARQIPAQSPPAAGTASPVFDVVSIKENRSGAISTKVTWYQYLVTCKTPEILIATAYGRNGSRYLFPLRPDQIVGGPGWVNSRKFDVDARVEESLAKELREHPEQTGDHMRLMLQSMLADRFALKISHGTKEIPAYALVTAKGGPKFLNVAPSDWPDPMAPGFDPSKAPPKTNCQLGWVCAKAHISMAELAAGLSVGPEIDRPVVDQTGLTGIYFLDYTYEHQHRPPMAVISADGHQSNPDVGPTPAGPSLREALEKQLGLKLQPAKTTVDTIVIDHIEMPSEN